MGREFPEACCTAVSRRVGQQGQGGGVREGPRSNKITFRLLCLVMRAHFGQTASLWTGLTLDRQAALRKRKHFAGTLEHKPGLTPVFDLPLIDRHSLNRVKPLTLPASLFPASLLPAFLTS